MTKREIIPLQIAAIFINLLCAHPPEWLDPEPDLFTSLIHITVACVVVWGALRFPFIEKTHHND